MTRTFIQTNEFSKNWDILGFDDEDLRILELSILEHPEKYPIMKGTGGLRKARIPIGRKGKKRRGKGLFCRFYFRRDGIPDYRIWKERKGQSFHNRTKSNQKDD